MFAPSRCSASNCRTPALPRPTRFNCTPWSRTGSRMCSRVTNPAPGACTEGHRAAVPADGPTFTGASGPTQIKATGQHVSFAPIQRLAAKGEAIYKVRVRGNVAGDQRFTVQLKCDQIATP